MKVVSWILAWASWHGEYYSLWHAAGEPGKTACGVPYDQAPEHVIEEWQPERFLNEVAACGRCKRTVERRQKEAASDAV